MDGTNPSTCIHVLSHPLPLLIATNPTHSSPTLTPSAPSCSQQTIVGKDQAFFDASTKGDLVSRLTVDVTVLQTTLAGENSAAGRPCGRQMCMGGLHVWIYLL